MNFSRSRRRRRRNREINLFHAPSKLTAPTETLAAMSDVIPAALKTVDEK
jgi:hypothetical protein